MEGEQLKRVDKYKYLCATINFQLDQDNEIGIETARKKKKRQAKKFSSIYLQDLRF